MNGRKLNGSLLGTMTMVVLLLGARECLATEVYFGSFVTTDVVLTRDLISNSPYAHGLYICADNITIDGNGYALICNGEQPRIGVNGIHNPKYKNVTLKNFSKISGFVHGVYVGSGADNMIIENCRIENNCETGIRSPANHTGLTIKNNVFQETNIAVNLTNASGFKLEGNRIIGGRVGFMYSGGSLAAFTGNRLEHQSQSALAGNRRLFRYTNVRRTGQANESFNYSLKMFRIDGSSSSASTCAVRTVPPTVVTANKSGDTVSGSFTPTRQGLHSLIAEITDPDGNKEVRLARIFVGPTIERTTKYYWNRTGNAPQHGQTDRGREDFGNMFLTPPTSESFLKCGGWVQVSPDQLTTLPAGIIFRADFNMFFRFIASTTWPARFGLQRDVTVGGNSDATVGVPSSLATGDANWGGESIWGEFSINNLNWSMDYPFEWHYLGVYFYASGPYVETGVAGKESHTVFRHWVTVSPEVQAVSNPTMLLLGATSAQPDSSDGSLTVLGDNNQADLTLANFRRPFGGTPTQIKAAGETVFNSGVVNGEKTFTAVPLEITPTANAVNVSVGIWNAAGDGRREWTEAAVGAPASVIHTLGGLKPQTGYRITVNGGELLTGQADAQGSLSFVYGGGFPASFAVTEVSANTPPVIDSAPTATPNPATVGQTVSFSVAASDADGDALSYVWTFGDGQSGSGATPTHVYNAAGTYTATVTVSDGKGGSASGSVTVTVNPPANQAPTVATAAKATPSPATGTTTVLSVLGADDGGEAALTYTWATTGTPPAAVSFSPNGTNAAKNSTATFTKAGSYSFQVTIKDAGNLTVTSSVNVIVNQTLTTITVAPTSASVNTGATQQFTATAKDQFGTNLTTQPTFSWTVSGGGTISSSGLFTAGTTAGGPYTVTAASGGKSGTASVTVTVAVVTPTITTQPANRTVTVGQTASFSVVASGTAPLVYQWRKNGTNISGATSASYTTPATVTADNGALFSVVVSNAAGSVTSNNATLTVNAIAPTITTQPANRTVTVGQTASFSVVASGTAPLTYQWRKNGTNISGATSASYTTPATVMADNGALFSVVVSNSAGSVTSNNATLTVNAIAPTITTQPANQTVTVGQTASFSVVASGTAPLSYQWRKNGTNISGATSASYTTPATVMADNGSTFSVVVSNSAGSATSNNATLTVQSSSTPGLVKLTAKDQFGATPTGAVVKIKLAGVWTDYPSGTDVQLTVGTKYELRAFVANITGASLYYTVTDNMTEIALPLWTATVRCRDQFGTNVSEAKVYINNVTGSPFVPGTAITLPKGYTASVRGWVPKVTGPYSYPIFTDGYAEIAPAFTKVTVRCRDQNDAVVPSGTGYLSYIGVEYFADGATATVPSNASIIVRSRRVSLYSDIERISFNSTAATFAAKFRSVTFKGVASDGMTLVPNAEVEIYGSGLAKFANGTAQSVPQPGTLRVRIFKDGKVIGDVSWIKIEATTTTVTVTTSWVAGASAPLGVNAEGEETGAGALTPNEPLALSKTAVKLNFSKTGSDQILVSGVLPIAEGYAVEGQTLTVNFGGVEETFVLNGRGQGKTAGGKFGLRLKQKRGAVVAQQAKFQLQLKKGEFAQALSAAGLTNADIWKASVTVPVLLTFDGTTYAADKQLLFSAKANKTGLAK
jgi:PKD repeat protein